MKIFQSSKFVITFIFIFVLNVSLFAQAPCDDCAGLPEPDLSDCLELCDGDVDDIPVNQYNYVLLGSGLVLFGFYFIRRHKKSLV